MVYLFCFSRDLDSKAIPAQPTTNIDTTGKDSDIMHTNNGLLPFMTSSSSTLINSSLLNQLQPTPQPISVLKGTCPNSGLSSSSTSPLTALPATAIPPLNRQSLVGYNSQGGGISTSTSLSSVPLSVNLGVGIPASSSNNVGEETPISMPPPYSTFPITSLGNMTSNILDASGMGTNNLTNVQAAILAASRLIAIPSVASIPTSAQLPFSVSPLTTTAPSAVTMGNGLTTYLNPNLISELLLAGGNIKTSDGALGGLRNTEIIHHELPENTTIYPISDPSKAIQGSPQPLESISLLNQPTKATPAFNSLNLAALLPNSAGTTTIGSLPYGVLGVTSSIANANNTTPSITIPPSKSVQTTHQTVRDGVLPDSTIAELSAATGLPSTDIAAWAAKLPSGSTVKVTRHFDTTHALKNKTEPSKSLSDMELSSSNMFPIKLPENISITATQSLLPPPPKLVAAPARSLSAISSMPNIIIPNVSSAPLVSSVNGELQAMPGYVFPNHTNNVLLNEYLANLRAPIPAVSSTTFTSTYASLPSSTKSLAQQNQVCLSIPASYNSSDIMTSQSNLNVHPNPIIDKQSLPTNETLCQEENDIKPPISNSYQDNQLLAPGSISLGLPSYQESFAVDPNEILCNKNFHLNNNIEPNTSMSSSSPSQMMLTSDHQRKSQRIQLCSDLNESLTKVTESSNISSYLDLNSNTLHNNNNGIFIKNENGLNPTILATTISNGSHDILPSYDQIMQDDGILRYVKF